MSTYQNKELKSKASRQIYIQAMTKYLVIIPDQSLTPTAELTTTYQNKKLEERQVEK